MQVYEVYPSMYHHILLILVYTSIYEYDHSYPWCWDSRCSSSWFASHYLKETIDPSFLTLYTQDTTVFKFSAAILAEKKSKTIFVEKLRLYHDQLLDMIGRRRLESDSDSEPEARATRLEGPGRRLGS